VSACQSTACTGSGFARLDLTYDGEGHRTRLVETTSGGTVTTTTFTYGGDVVVREVTTGAATITRTFVTDEAGAIVKVTISGDPVSLHNGTYLVTWNGHGDAQALAKVDPGTGTLTPANRYTYTTWGTPTTTTLNGYADLRFRYLYVGQYGVTWDHTASVPTGFHYMRARHYSPEFGRFLQPDPSRLETNHYGYAGNGPAANIDPDGTWKKLCMCGALGGGRIDGRKVAKALGEAIRAIFGPKRSSKKPVITTSTGEKVRGYTDHALSVPGKGVIDREGVGVAARAILDALKRPIKIKPASGSRGTTYYGKNAAVVVRKGKIITAWALNRHGHRIK
jgi:RHS repeat-associated protein